MKKFHLSTYISIIVTLLVISSTFVVSGILYFSLSKSLTKEFEDRVRAQSGEAVQILSGKFQQTRNRLREISLDNTIRVTLMLGVYQQLQEHLNNKYGLQKDTHFCIRPLHSDKIFKTFNCGLDNGESEKILMSSGSEGKIKMFKQYGLLYFLSCPVFRQKDQIGTAGAIYILKNDKNLYNSISKNKYSSIFKVTGGKAWDIFTGKPLQGFQNFTGKIKNYGLSYIVLNRKKTAVVVNRKFPDLIYITRLDALHNAKIKVLIPVLYSVIFVLVLTIFISFFLSRLLVKPLSELSKRSLIIADEQAFPEEKKIVSSNIIEVEQLMSSLFIMVNNLKKTEELRQYRQLFENVADPVFIYDFSGNILEVNEIAVEQFGFSRKELDHMALTDMITGKQHRKLFRRIPDLSKTDERIFFETEMLTKNNKLIYIEFHARKIFFKGERAVLNVARDITDRKKIQRDLIRSEERLSLALEVSLAITWELNLKTGKFIIDTDKFKFPGYGKTDLKKITDTLKMIHPKKVKGAKYRFNKFLEGKTSYYSDEFSVLTENGEQRWFHNRAKIVKFDDKHKPMVVIGTAIDISELKQAEQTLRDNEERYRTILENRNIGYFEVDLKGNMTFFNDAMCDISGYPHDELLGMNYRDYSDDETSAEIKKKYQTIFKTGMPLKSFEYSAFRKSGDQVEIEASVSLRTDLNGRPCGFRGLIVDITDRKIAEQARKELEVELRQSHKMEAIGTLAGGIAHDFNNILSGIFGYCQLAEMNVGNPVKTKAYISQVFKGAQRAAGLIQQILAFARQTEHVKHPLNIASVVKETLKLLRATIPTTIEIKSSICSDTPVMADPIQIHQVIMNLCTNAYHAMREKGGILEVELNDIEISRENSIPDINISPGKYVKLKISDTGHGMDEDILEKIFDPYFTTKKKGEGTGLGLALVYTIVKEHNGYIKAYSTVGEGTKFYIFFPVTDEIIISREQSGDTRPVKGGKESIMVVDDENSILYSIEEFLKDYGYKVATFSNGADAFEEFEKFPHDFDLVITDMTMPRMTGDRLSVNILKIRKDIPIILCSGYSENISEEKAIEIGIKKYVQKPIDSQRLMSLIHELLDK